MSSNPPFAAVPVLTWRLLFQSCLVLLAGGLVNFLIRLYRIRGRFQRMQRDGLVGGHFYCLPFTSKELYCAGMQTQRATADTLQSRCLLIIRSLDIYNWLPRSWQNVLATFMAMSFRIRSKKCFLTWVPYSTLIHGPLALRFLLSQTQIQRSR